MKIYVIEKRNIVKEIGQKLKEKREEDGLSIEEVAEDLKMRPTQIESLEEGKREAFDDILLLKYFIRDYAKYLGLDPEKMIDEFNEYLFDYTSKIPLDAIEKAKKEKKENKDKVASPYTINKKEFKIPLYVIILFIIIVIIFVTYIIFSNVKKNDFVYSNVSYANGGLYE